MFAGSINTWLETIPEAARDESRSRLKRLSRLVSEGKVCFLCGAGMSKASGLPLAQDLGAMMVGEYLDGERPKKNEEQTENPWPKDLEKLTSSYPIEAIAEAYLKKLDRPHLTNLLAEAVGYGSAICHDGHKALENLATQSFIDRVYTTNFDSLIEDGLGERGLTLDDKSIDKIYEKQHAGKIPVMHLHGYLGSECLLEESKTYRLDTPLSRLMMADMVTKWFVWVGYSLSDIDLRTIYFSMQETLAREDLAKRPFVVHPLTSDDKWREWRLADAVWDSRYATFLPGKAEHFLPALARQVYRSRAKDLAEKIVEKRGGNPKNQAEIDSLWEEARNMAAKSRLGDEVQAMEVIADAEGLL